MEYFVEHTFHKIFPGTFCDPQNIPQNDQQNVFFTKMIHKNKKNDQQNIPQIDP